MKLQITLAILGGAIGSLIMCAQAPGAFTGLDAQLHSVVNIGGTTRCVFRVYALCSDPNDFITSVSGSSNNGALVIENRNAANTGLGSGFFNVGGNDTAPSLLQILGNPNVEWDTFATIGVAIEEQGSGPGLTDETSLSPGFPNFIAGPLLTSTNIAWFTPGPVEQGRAGYVGDGDLLLRVMLMQLTVNLGESIRGTVNLTGVDSVTGPFSTVQQTFAAGHIPGPGGLALLGLALVIPGGRRRKGKG